MSEEKQVVSALVLDYDGVLKYKDKNLTQQAQDRLIEFLVGKTEREFTLHINTLRGLSLFKQDIIERIKKLELSHFNFVFSGCAGACTLNMLTGESLQSTQPLGAEVIEYFNNSSHVDSMLRETGQSDFGLWSESLSSRSDLEKMFAKKDIYWDFGFPDSNEILKIALDITGERSREILELIKRDLDQIPDVNYFETNGVFEVVHTNISKGTAMQVVLEKGYYAGERIAAIADNPDGVDKPMFVNSLAVGEKTVQVLAFSTEAALEAEALRIYLDTIDSLTT